MVRDDMLKKKVSKTSKNNKKPSYYVKEFPRWIFHVDIDDQIEELICAKTTQLELLE